MTEQIFVVPSSLVVDTEKDTVIAVLPGGHFTDRDTAETNEDLKQIIPYVTIQRADDDKYLAYKRSKKAGETRLHDKWSVGFGGHVNPEDLPEAPKNEMSFLYAIERELTEELKWENDRVDQFVISMEKIIYDDSDALGRVHLGLNFGMLLQEGASMPIEAISSICLSMLN